MPVLRRTVLIAALAGLVLPGAARSQEDEMFAAHLALLDGDADGLRRALAAIVARGNPDMVAGLIDAMRFTASPDAPFVEALQQITGQNAGGTWFDWMVWQQNHPELIPHPSYPRWKREIYLRIDPNFDVFLRPEDLRRDRMKIRLEEITWGGVLKDGIPSLDRPDMIGAARADYLREDDLVFGVAINGDVRAYPLRIMGWHEMFNDVIGGVPVALAYCTLCGSGILYETSVAGRGKPLIFGSSGFLYRSNKLMFDRATHSLWNQFTGKPVVGPLADSGITLQQRPVAIARWDDWQAANPGTTVLALDTGYRRDYGPGVVYRSYFASDDLMFPAVVDQSKLNQKDYVFGIRQFGAAKAWPLTAFARTPVINDRVGDTAVVVIGDPESRTARAYERGEQSFVLRNGQLISKDGTAWQRSEDQLTAPDGRRFARVAGHVAYWFAWDGYLGEAADLYRP